MPGVRGDAGPRMETRVEFIVGLVGFQLGRVTESQAVMKEKQARG